MGRPITIGAKVAPELGLAVDRVILAYPKLFKDRSSFLRTAVTRFLTELRFAEQPVNLQTPGGATTERTDDSSSVNHEETSSSEGPE